MEVIDTTIMAEPAAEGSVENYGSEPSDSSVDDDDEDDHDDDVMLPQQHGRRRKLTFGDVKRQINKAYEPDLVHRYSSALDILASYLKGQKIIYMEARLHTVSRLNCLMLPAIFLSSLVSILQKPLAPLYPDALAGISGFVAFILAIITYLKLDAAAEAHKISAHQYDKLQSYVEFQSGQVLLFSHPLLNPEAFQRHCTELRRRQQEQGEPSDDTTLRAKLKQAYDDRLAAEADLNQLMSTNIKSIDEKIADIKETNQFIIPHRIRDSYTLIYNTNVFAVIKKIDDYRARTLTDLKHVKNELRFLQAQQPAHHKRRISQLFQQKRALINTILFLNTAFSMIDQRFQAEIENAKLRKKYWLRYWLRDLFYAPDNQFNNRLAAPNSHAEIIDLIMAPQKLVPQNLV